MKSLDDVLKEINGSVFTCQMGHSLSPNPRKAVPLPAVQELYNFARFANDTISDMRKAAIENGAAQYNPTTGEFEWNQRA